MEGPRGQQTGRTPANRHCSSSYAGTNQIKFAVPAVRSAISARHHVHPGALRSVVAPARLGQIFSPRVRG